MEKHFDTPPTEPQKEVTLEMLQQVLVKTNEMLKSKGMSAQVVEQINSHRKDAERLNAVSWIIESNQVKFLAGQHGVMEGDKKGAVLMLSSLADMELVAATRKNEINDVVYGRIDRFRGKVAEGLHAYSLAEMFYKNGSNYFRKFQEVDKRYLRLEFDAFEIHTLFLQGKQEKAKEKMEQLLVDFDNSEEGKWMATIQDEDGHFGYAKKVWKAGLEIRSATDIMAFKNPTDTGLIKRLLDDAEKTLVFDEDGSKSGFDHRLDELTEAKKNFYANYPQI